MVDENLINYSLDDLKVGIGTAKSIQEVETKIKNNENFRKIILYLGIHLFNHHDYSNITIKQINDSIIKKTPDYTAKLMEYLVIQNFLIKINRERTNFYVLNKEEDNVLLFKQFVELAKKIQFGEKK